MSLDFIHLHREIQGLQEAGPLQFDAAEEASKFLQHLKSLLPILVSFGSFAYFGFRLGPSHNYRPMSASSFDEILLQFSAEDSGRDA